MAILLVLMYHFTMLVGGSMGVDLFFVLSGFLITTLLLEEWQRNRSIGLLRFYVRRAFRLWPALFAMLLIRYVVTIIASPDEVSTFQRQVLLAMCYVSNWMFLSMGSLNYTWSLSVEEQFYLVWPILLYAMLRCGFSPRLILAVICLGIGVCATERYIIHMTHLHTTEEFAAMMRMYTGSDTRADTLLVGCLIGVLATSNLLPKSRRFVFCNGIAALIALRYWDISHGKWPRITPVTTEACSPSMP